MDPSTPTTTRFAGAFILLPLSLAPVSMMLTAMPCCASVPQIGRESESNVPSSKPTTWTLAELDLLPPNQHDPHHEPDCCRISRKHIDSQGRLGAECVTTDMRRRHQDSSDHEHLPSRRNTR